MSGEGEKPRIVYYRPTPAEQAVHAAIAGIAGLLYLAYLADRSGDIYTVFTWFIIAVVVTYIAMVSVSKTLVRLIAVKTGKLRIAEAKTLIELACGEELDDHQVVRLLAEARSRTTTGRRKKEKKVKESQGL